MTVLDKIKSAVADKYSLSEDTFLSVLEDRGISPTADFSVDVRKEFDLAKADLYVVLVTFINVDEGGFGKSATDKSNYLRIANSIYLKYGEPIITEKSKTIKVPRGRAPQRW